jgi:magnesium transporter
MDSQTSSDSAHFLQQQLEAVIKLLEKQELENSLVRKSTSSHHDLEEVLVNKQHEVRLQELLSDLHPADIAFILESLPLDQRKQVWNATKSDMDGQILLEVSDSVRETLIADMEPEELATFATNLDADEIAELAEDLPKRAMLKILRSLNSQERSHLKTILSYEDDQVGAFMDFNMIAIREDLSLEAVIDYIRNLGKLPSHTDKLFVVDQQNIVKGVLPVQRLLTHEPFQQVAEAMVSDFVQFKLDEDLADASRAFERYDLISAPVIDAQGQLQGRLSVANIIDFIREKSDEDLLSQAGVEEDEDLFSGVWKSAQNRWGWLLINIATAFASTRIIDVFQEIIVQLVALASLMPIVAAMGGNMANQTSMLIIRSLALGHITAANVRRLIRKELSLGLLNGAIIGLLIGMLSWLLYRDTALSLVMGAAMLINLMLAVAVGLTIPLGRYKLGKDPAIGASVMLTAITDSMGFFIFLGLAKLFLVGK